MEEPRPTASTDRARTARLAPLGVAIALALALVAGSTPRALGDGYEYLTEALNFASHGRPWLASEDIPALQARLTRFDPRAAAWPIDRRTMAARDGTRDFAHFWLYPLLAAPGVAVTNWLDASPAWPFVCLHLVLLAGALAVALPRLGAGACVLLFASPIIWWIDKPHTEILTFSLLAVGLLLVEEAPAWAMIAFGAASTQNPPIAAAAAFAFVLHVVSRTRHVRSLGFWAGAGAAALLCALSPGYYLLRHGTLAPLARYTRAGLPAPEEFMAVVWDPAMGLLPHFPGLAVACLAALVVVLRRRPRALLSRDVLLAVSSGLVFLLAFGSTLNLHSGATAGINRYALWLIPLALPLLRRAGENGAAAWRWTLWTVALSSGTCSLFAYHPAVAQFAREPTPLARYLWSSHPRANNPLPEVFAEVQRYTEGPTLPIATPGCEKVLLMAEGATTGSWPMPCYPASAPQECRQPGLPCYANREGDRYHFVRAPGRPLPSAWIHYSAAAAWPVGAEPVVRQVFRDWRWWESRVRGPRDGAIRGAANIERAWDWEGPSRHLVVIVRPGTGAVLSLRIEQAVGGLLIDASTGQVLQEVTHPGGPQMWDVAIPGGHEILLLALRAR